jgi:hypothetical protein
MIKTKQELEDFCTKNAGKIASGHERNTNVLKRGRIVAFMIDQFHNLLVLLEDEPPKIQVNIPSPLSTTPYQFKNWHWVIAPAYMGAPVKAETIVLGELRATGAGAAVYNQPQPQAQGTLKAIVEQAQAAARVCKHPECDTWCHRNYIGVM